MTNKNKHTEGEIVEALFKKYSANPGNGPRYVCSSGVRNQAGFDATRTCDFIAIDTWPSKGLVMFGHEIKCSRADWLTELKDPTKAEAFKKNMDFWYLVVSDAAFVKPGELPEDWGLMVLDGRGISIKKQAPRLTKATSDDGHLQAKYQPIPRSFGVALLRSTATQQYNRGLRDGEKRVIERQRNEKFDIKGHYHGNQSDDKWGRGTFHEHAWASVKHSHIVRGVCMREECEVMKTHDIHGGPDTAMVAQ